MASQLLTRAGLSPAYLAEDDSAPLLGTCIAFLIIDSLLISLHYTACLLRKDTKANMLMTMLMTGAYCVCVGKITLGFLMIHIGGAGHHLAALSASTATTMTKLTTVLQIICPLTTSLTKLGILCLLNQIFGRTSKKYRIVIKATFAAVLAITIIQVIIPFANCKPFSKTWHPFGPGTCAFNGLDLWRYLSIPNIITTIVMVFIPLPAMYKLKVSAPMKLGLGIVFGVCLLGVVAAIMRFQSFLSVRDFHDITYEAIKPLCWTIAESGIYLAAGVLPTLRPLMKKLFGHIEFERMLSRTFGSWGNNPWSKIGGQPLPQSPEKGSVATAETFVGSGGNSKTGTTDTVFSDKSRSIVVMLDRQAYTG